MRKAIAIRSPSPSCRRPPKVLSVDAAAPDGVYKAGDTITLTVTFDGWSTSTPPAERRHCCWNRRHRSACRVCLRGSGSNTLSFSYTVQAGDSGSGSGLCGHLALAAERRSDQKRHQCRRRSDTADAGRRQLDRPRRTTSSWTAVGPTVTSVGVPAAGTYKFGDSLDFAINFHEAVTVDTTNGVPRLAVMLDMGGTPMPNIAGSGSTALHSD
ncbi:hypothetical protein F2981_16360 [Sinorhizobium meliloti]|nr:hypothetical protein [Sinorhizobium meliloti]